GLAGLSAGVRLVDAGHRVTILEREQHVGGRTGNWTEDGMPVETGLHRYLGFYVELPRLLRHVGAALNDVVTWTDEVEMRLPDGGPSAVYATSLIHRPFASIARGLGNNHYVGLGQKLALARMIGAGALAYLRHPSELDHVSVADYARRHGVADATIKRILYPLTEGLFFVPPDEYSAHNFMGILVPYWNSVIKTRVGSFAGGMTDVMCAPMARYVTDHGGEVRTGVTVERLAGGQVRITGVVTADGTIDADDVVLAASLGPAKNIVKETLGDHPWFSDMQRLSSTPAVCFQAELDRPCLPKDRATFGPGTDLGSFAEQSRTTFKELDGRLSVIMAQPHKYVDATAEQLTPVVIDEAKRLGIGLEGRIVRASVIVIPDDFYSLRVGNEHLRPAQETPVPGLALAGDYTRQKYLATMEGAVVSGKRAADAVITRRKEER
ncbi:FAD-dependent oxidoreductase, partial [Demequina sp. TTPB684]